MTQFFQSYLVAFMVVFGVSAGSLGVLLLHLLVGGQWGRVSRLSLRAGVATLPFTALLFLPILFGIHSLYPWVHPEVSAELGRKAAWLTPGFFTLRAVVIWVGFNLLGWHARRKMDLERPDSPEDYYQATGALGVIAYFVLVTFAAFDWTMSLEPSWASTLYGVMVVIGQGLTTFAFTIISLTWIQPKLGKPVAISEKASHDLGNLLFAFTILWTYMEVSQFIIIWSGNLPEEIPWYLVRSHGGWDWIITFLVLAQFLLPFLLLLAKRRKKDLSRLVRVAVFVLVVRVIDLFWFIAPDFHPGRLQVHLFDVVLIAALAGAWFAVYRWRLRKEVLAS